MRRSCIRTGYGSSEFGIRDSESLIPNPEPRIANRYSCGFSSPEIRSFNYENRGLRNHGRNLISSLRARSSSNIASICPAIVSS